MPPSMHAAALGRYVAEQLGLPPAEAVELACGGEMLAGTATLGETLEGLRAHAVVSATAAAAWSRTASAAAALESLMLVIRFRVVLAAAAPADARRHCGCLLGCSRRRGSHCSWAKQGTFMAQDASR